MIHIVSGYMRTGTSMMMAALEAGGLNAIKNETRDEWADTFSDNDYHPNKQGLYELHGRQIQEHLFNPDMSEGKLIKILFAGVPRLAAAKYRIVFMEREWEECRQSHMAFFGVEPRINENQFHQMMAYTKGILRQRNDIALTCFWYRDVLREPLKHFKRLAKAGWPIDAEKAAAIADRTQCHYKLEDLEVGIL